MMLGERYRPMGPSLCFIDLEKPFRNIWEKIMEILNVKKNEID